MTMHILETPSLSFHYKPGRDQPHQAELKILSQPLRTVNPRKREKLMHNINVKCSIMITKVDADSLSPNQLTNTLKNSTIKLKRQVTHHSVQKVFKNSGKRHFGLEH